MKILLLTTHSPFVEVTGPIAAGAEIAMRRIAEKLAERGHEVHYLTFCPDTEGFLQLKGVNIHFYPQELPKEKQGGAAEQLTRELATRLRDRIWRFKNSQFARNTGAAIDRFIKRLNYHSWEYKRLIADIVDRYQIEVVHCFSSMPDSLAAATVCHKRNIPLVIRMGGRYWFLKYQRLPAGQSRLNYLSEMNYVFHIADCLAYNSHFLHRETTQMFESLGIDAKPSDTILDIGVALPGVEVEDPLAQHALDDCFVAACIGKFKDDSKRQDLLVDGLQYIPQTERRKFRLVFAGSGPTEERIKGLAAKHGLDEQCIFLGNIPHTSVFSLMQRADVICHPTEFEGSSKAVAEAMLCRKAVIGSNIPPLAEHLNDNENGFLAENTAQEFGLKLRYALENPTELTRVADNAYQYAAEHFNPDRNVLLYEELFQQLIEGKKETLLKKAA